MNMIKTDWKTRHVRVPCFIADDGWERGGITLRYRVIEEGIQYMYSICNPKDQYSRKVGIELADTGFSNMLGIYVDGRETAFNLEAAILMHIVEEQRGELLSKTTLDLIYSFVRNGIDRELKQFFYPKKLS